MAGFALYNRGYAIIHPSVKTSFSGGGKRGKLTGKVSSASFRRLRTWCVKHDIFSDCWGITLTVPGIDVLPVQTFKDMHHKLCVWANDNSVPLVWRVELQQRGQPHLHIVLFGTIDVALFLCLHWYHLLDSLPGVYNVERVSRDRDDLVLISRALLRGSQYAVDLQQLRGDFRAWRYLVAHMSKGKKAQLGWSGRNWGVCNRAMFGELDCQKYDLSDKVFYSVRRWIRRLTRMKARRGVSYMLGNPETIKSMIQYASNADDVPF